jgi:MOSC domain-containing protein YiiM
MGQFGENLTTEGLLESDVHIGDRFQVGKVILEVSEPRSPYYKFAIKMGSVESLPVCINSAETGFYCRVLSEVVIQSGDRIEFDYSNDTAPTVEEAHNLYCLDKQNIVGLTRTSECDSLAKGWRELFEKRISKLAAKIQ